MKKHIIFLLLFIFYHNVYCQDYVKKPEIVSSSPESNIFEKYYNHNITEYNGLPEIKIPLYVIETKGISIPIILTYHGSGIKFKQFDGDVGAGWALNVAGFRVTRTIYGRADEKFPIFNPSHINHLASHGYIKDSFLGSIGGEVYSSANMLSAGPVKEYQDGEHDQFTYMMPSTNGVFIITDRNLKNTAKIENNNDKIILDELENKVKLENISILDGFGNMYLMGKNPDGTLLTENNREPSGWPLKRILTQYNEVIDFKYKKCIINQQPNTTRTLTILDAAVSCGSRLVLRSPTNKIEGNYNATITQACLIDEIRTEKEIIHFIRKDNLITEITISDLYNTVIKKIKLEYEYKSPHNLLKSIKIGDNTNYEKIYSLENFDGLLSSRSGIDQWGYYLELPKAPLYSDLFLHSEFKEDNILQSISSSSTNIIKIKNSSIFNSSFDWIDRTNLVKIPVYYSLKKITYPTGGYTEYEYESNQYINNSSVIKGGGLRVKKITSKFDNSSPLLTTIYKYGINEDGNGIPNINLSAKYFADEYYSLNTSQRQVPGNITYNDVDIYPMKVYSTSPLIPEVSNFKVQYEQVARYEFEDNKNMSSYNGKIVSNYSINSQYEEDFFSTTANMMINGLSYTKNMRGNNQIKKYKLGVQPQLTTRNYYDKNNKSIRVEFYTNNYIKGEVYKGIRAKQRIFMSNYGKEVNWQYYDVPYKQITSLFDNMEIIIETGYYETASKFVYYYPENTTSSMTIEGEQYQYNAYRQLTKLTTYQNSDGKRKYIEYKYPRDLTIGNDIYFKMISKNLTSPIIEETTLIDNNEIFRKKTEYTNDPSISEGLILPQSIKISHWGGNFRNELDFNKYDKNGNLLQFKNKEEILTSYLWSYTSKYPIAEIINASYNDVVTQLNKLTINSINLSNDPNPSDDLLTKIKQLETLLPNAKISYYKYKPLFGIIEKTNHFGLTTYYEYNKFGSLYKIYIKEKDINNQYIIKNIQTFEYNYINK